MRHRGANWMLIEGYYKEGRLNKTFRTIASYSSKGKVVIRDTENWKLKSYESYQCESDKKCN